MAPTHPLRIRTAEPEPGGQLKAVEGAGMTQAVLAGKRSGCVAGHARKVAVGFSPFSRAV